MKYALGNNGRLSGRADANVYNRNYVVRGFSMPSNPQTAAQSVQRGNFGSFSGNWNNLTEEQRATWNDLSIDTVDNLGHPVTLSGKTLYVRLNRNLFNAGQAALTSAPTPASPLAPTSVDFGSATSGSVSLDFVPSAVPSGTTWLVYCTAPQTPGTYRPGQSKYKLTTVLPAATATGADITAEYEALFGALPTGAAVFVKLVAIKNSTGFASPSVGARTIST